MPDDVISASDLDNSDDDGGGDGDDDDHGAKMTSYRRRCDVITSHRR